MEKSLWKSLWTCRKTEYVMNELTKERHSMRVYECTRLSSYAAFETTYYPDAVSVRQVWYVQSMREELRVELCACSLRSLQWVSTSRLIKNISYHILNNGSKVCLKCVLVCCLSNLCIAAVGLTQQSVKWSRVRVRL